MQTCQNFLDQLCSAADKAARRISPVPSVIDSAAHDQDDYRMIFLEKAWSSTQKTPVALYGYRTIWNELSDRARKRSRIPPSMEFDPDYSPVPDNLIDRGLEARVRAREKFQILERNLNPEDWRLLRRHAECETIEATWKAEGCPVSYKGFARRIQKLRQRCKEILCG